MPLVRTLAALATAACLTAGVLVAPGAAYAADVVTSLTAGEMENALAGVGTTTGAASADGWRSDMSITRGSMAMSAHYAVDAATRLGLSRLEFDGDLFTRVFAGGRGTYDYITDSRTRAVVTMMKRPGVRYMFGADTSVDVSDGDDFFGPSPLTVLTEDAAHAGTRTVHDDGSADFAFTADGSAVQLAVDAAGVLTRVDVTDPEVAAVLTFGYGPQVIALPTAAQTISVDSLARGAHYYAMAGIISATAREGAARARRAAKGGNVDVESLRKAVKREVSGSNRDAGFALVKIKNVRGGVKVGATNPWTGRTVAYTVKASGRKVVVKRL
ncbi:hypothetical protein [Spirilliplanes yamanashiensis]|uniref:Uncharacterized protein n=1 Tax=Spirilliplanes yamanashiensis TaxID=42233 RepID=A0A8J4DJ22_9ACTN|nr:hypothetical protein [Spirilliplanes yamanashiensis]MDP9815148.1 hypothetical protein [Spirilliplanes yamanashiensis]GIJ02803.1 hypothetical protein Sya03_21550 [Spirilliplanes yamanashiensis]